MAAAVADYAPDPVDGKRPKTGEPWSARAAADRGHPRASSARRRTGPLLVGFGAEEGEAGPGAQARGCSPTKHVDLVVFNDVSQHRHRLRLARERGRARLCRGRADGGEGAEGAHRRRDPGRGRAADSGAAVAVNPPADSSSAAMRASSGGWVSKSPRNAVATPVAWFWRVLDVDVRDRSLRVRGSRSCRSGASAARAPGPRRRR